MAVGFSNTNKPINPRGNDASPKGYNRAALYSGKALDFDGVNDYVSIGTQSFITASGFSFSAKLYLEDDSEHYIFSTGYNNTNSILLYSPASSNDLVFAWYNTSSGALLSTGVNYTNDEWFDISVNYDGSILTIYKNGVEVVNESFSIPTIASGPYEIGWSSPRAKSTAYLQGKVAGFKIFNTALTAAQVADLYNNPEKIVPTGVADSALKLWLPMMEGAGTTAYDGSGNGNHGTISGATYVNGVGSPVAQSAVIDWNKGQNLYAYSEQFDESSYWSYTQIHAVDSTDNEAPDGSLTADKLIANTNTAFHHIGKGVTGITIGVSYRLSVWAKAGGHDYILINTAGGSASGNAGPIVNLTNGSIAGSLNGEDYDATITDAGNGWYKIEYDFTSNGTTISIDYNQLPSASITAYAGDNTKGVYLWGASLRPASSGSTYVRTGATPQTSPVLLPQGLTTGRDITGVNLFENVRKQGALNLDGNSWAEVHDNASLDMTDAISAECWVYWRQSTASNDSGLLSRWDGATGRQFLIYHNTTTSVQFYIDNANSKYQSMTEGWHHIVGTYDKVNRKIYVDGVLRDTDAQTISIPSSDDKIEIGRYSHIASKNTEDTIAQPRIYNRALTAEEVLRNYNSGKSTYQ